MPYAVLMPWITMAVARDQIKAITQPLRFSCWESDNTYLGNYSDPWLGVGFNIDLLNITLSAGPRLYSPGSYSGLPFRTDWGGEIELEYPLADSVVLFAHYRPTYSGQAGEGWGAGWQHHIGSGISLSF